MDASELVRRAWPAVRAQALSYAATAPPSAADEMTDLLSRPQWELQFFAVCALGKLAARDRPALDLLRQVPAGELHWQVNEGLAFAFDYYCAGVGYQESLPEIRRWLGSPHANQRRAVSEGTATVDGQAPTLLSPPSGRCGGAPGRAGRRPQPLRARVGGQCFA
jgi:hypothetical protein